ncbi:proteasome assembly chaperone family protein [Candidatus Woesearchaeota archaeon]|nr:proteasome assembly chaperone family protein [Candidatus Woesearchaeota archaeon]
MEIKLTKKPVKPKIIDGFPGFGLIGTITTEFLIEHLGAEKIGSFHYDELPATIAIHKEKLVDPMGIFYNKKYNIVILHTILNSVGLEWKLSSAIHKMAKDMQTTEIISIEGVSSPQVTESENVFYFTNSSKNRTKIDKMGLQPLKESIIVGVSAALMLRSKIPLTCFFAETKSELPDSKAASNIIKVLDDYLGLKVDFKPLLKQAEEFEEKFKTILKQSSLTQKERDKKQMSYLG